MELRQLEIQRLGVKPELTTGNIISINMTRIYGGEELDIIPDMITVCFDVRLPSITNQDEFEDKLREICNQIGGIDMAFDEKRPRELKTATDDSNTFWTSFKSAIEELGLKINLMICPGATDSRFIREAGIPAIGFTPINNTPMLAHDDNEYISASTFLKGVEIYKKIIPKLANVTKCSCALKRNMLWAGAKAELPRYRQKPRRSDSIEFPEPCVPHNNPHVYH